MLSLFKELAALVEAEVTHPNDNKFTQTSRSVVFYKFSIKHWYQSIFSILN